MTATVLTPTTSAAAGVVYNAAAAVDAGSGNRFTNPTGRAIMEVINGAASTIVVTIVTQGTYAVGSVTYPIADLAVNVVNGTSKIFGPFDKALFNDTNGDVQVTYSSGTTITARVIELGTA